MRRAAKIDDNQNEIVKTLRQIPGVSVQPIHMIGKGVPDLLVGFRHNNFLLEIKDGQKVASAQKLTPDERVWHELWRGQVATVNSLDEALRALGLPAR